MLVFYGCNNSTFYIDVLDMEEVLEDIDISWWAVPGTLED